MKLIFISFASIGFAKIHGIHLFAHRNISTTLSASLGEFLLSNVFDSSAFLSEAPYVEEEPPSLSSYVCLSPTFESTVPPFRPALSVIQKLSGATRPPRSDSEEAFASIKTLESLDRNPTCPYSRALHRPDINLADPLFASATKFQCPLGELESSGRFCRHSTHPAPECPPNFEKRGKQCIRFVSRERVCPDGYSLPSDPTNGHCSRTITLKAEPQCPQSFALLPNICIRLTETPPTCPPGYLPSESNPEECTQFISKVFAGCPKGLQARGDVCVDGSYSVDLPSPLCPKGLLYDDSTAFCKESAAVFLKPSCLDGYTFVDGMCQLHGEKVLTCAEGYSLRSSSPQDDAKCVRTLSRASQEICDAADGFTLLNGVCAKLLEIEPAYECQDTLGVRSQRFGNICIADVDVGPPSRRCPDNFFFSGDGRLCLQKIRDCASSRVSCSSSGCASRNVCQKFEHTSPFGACKVGAEVVNGRCILKHVKSAAVTCPAGWVFDEEKRMCISRIEKPLSRSCPEGFEEDNGACSGISIEKPSINCKFTPTPQRAVTTPFIQPSVDGSCILKQKPLTPAGQGVRVSPTLFCHKGISLNGLCLSRRSVPRVPECPEESVPVGDRCQRVAPKIPHPSTRETVPINFHCPDDFDLKGYTCERGQLVPVESRCPKGSLAVGHEQCMEVREVVKQPPFVIRAPAVPVCPVGFVFLDDGVCSFS